jgi:CheY-like chemotaxis protein
MGAGSAGSGEIFDEALPPVHSCVLVIDDDATQRDLMRRFLTSEGFSVQTASGGAEGLRLAHLLLPVAIALDVMMPGMDGWSVLACLKAAPELCDIPVIMVTMVDDKKRGHMLGAADYTTKPIDRKRLLQILKKYSCPHPPCPVLLVEDDIATREMMRLILEKAGWCVGVAENGREALQRMAENRPSLILLDLMMPGMDGFEFAAEVHRHIEWRSIPIVVLTAKDLTSDELRRLNGNVHTVIDKGGAAREELMLEVRDLIAGFALPAAAADKTALSLSEERAVVNSYV